MCSHDQDYSSQQAWAGLECLTAFIPVPADNNFLSLSLRILIILIISVGIASCASVGLNGEMAFNTKTTQPSAALATSLLVGPGFEANQGQIDSEVRFSARSQNRVVSLTSNEVIFSLPQLVGTANLITEPQENRLEDMRFNVFRMSFEDSHQEVEISGERQLPGVVHYFIGNDPSRWRTFIPTYRVVRYRNLYPGVDLVLERTSGQLSYRFELAPGADPETIGLAFHGTKSISINQQGDLVVAVPGGILRHSAPRLYQDNGTGSSQVNGGFILRKDKVGFAVGEYDRTLKLVIDPLISLELSAIFGGPLAVGLAESHIAVGPDGAVHLTGTMAGAVFTGADPATYSGFWDGFVAKYDLSNPAVPGAMYPLWATYIGGTETDYPLDIAVDRQGLVYITGQTRCSPECEGLPRAELGYQPQARGDWDAFVTKLSASGLVERSTYLGGEGDIDAGYAIAIDDRGLNEGTSGVYVAGKTNPTDSGFRSDSCDPDPATPSACSTLQRGAGDDGFLVKLNNRLSNVIYFSYLGGGSQDSILDLEVRDGEAWVTGATKSYKFPRRNALQNCLNQPGVLQCTLPPPDDAFDVFVSRFSAAGDELVFSTLLGGSDDDLGSGVAVSQNGTIYVTGRSKRGTRPFPATPSAYHTEIAGISTQDGFLARLDPVATGMKLGFWTYLGGEGVDSPQEIALDKGGFAYITGWTNSGERFAESPALFDDFETFGRDAFIVRIGPAGQELDWWALIGGDSWDVGSSVALDGHKTIYVSGFTKSSDFQLEPPLGTPTWNSIFVVKIGLCGRLAINTTYAPELAAIGETVTFYITLANTGDCPLTGVGLNHRLDEESAQFVVLTDPDATAGTCAMLDEVSFRCELDPLPPGTEVRIRIAGLGPQAGTIKNIVRAWATEAAQVVDEDNVTIVP